MTERPQFHGPFGVKAQWTMAYLGVLSHRHDAPISTALLFFSAVRILDADEDIIDAQARSTALENTRSYLMRDPWKAYDAFKPFIVNLIETALAGDLEGYLRPIDLLEAAARESPEGIEAGLRTAGLSLDGVLERVRQLPPDRLTDRPASLDGDRIEPPGWLRKAMNDRA